MESVPASTVDPTLPPADWWRFALDGQALGWLAPRHQQLLSDWGLGEALAGARTWTIRSGAPHAQARSHWLAELAQRLHEAGWIRGWRGERYRCQLPGPESAQGPADGPVFFELERAAYRFFGLTSQAVHVNGVDEAGSLWCGRRSLRKATDPGRLDNLAAGGLPAGEDLLECARRELWEEAGVPASLCAPLRLMGRLRTARVEPEGWHDEWLHVFELQLPAGFIPSNQDGEVTAFERLAPEALARRLATQDFSPDAAAVTAFWLASTIPG
ncbi:DUF4743 domain-containing protein [Roseateles sp. DB2]|uniref:NUDIX hydrolase n=1 Tax=Roseateles sp. DB2 TaxID=3453717 RepID=UPI003EEDC794